MNIKNRIEVSDNTLDDILAPIIFTNQVEWLVYKGRSELKDAIAIGFFTEKMKTVLHAINIMKRIIYEEMSC